MELQLKICTDIFLFPKFVNVYLYFNMSLSYCNPILYKIFSLLLIEHKQLKRKKIFEGRFNEKGMLVFFLLHHIAKTFINFVNSSMFRLKKVPHQSNENIRPRSRTNGSTNGSSKSNNS